MNKSGRSKQRGGLTVSKELQDGEVHVALPVGILLDGDAVACGGKDVAAADGHQLAALVPARLVVQHSCIVDESVQFAEEDGKKSQSIRSTDSVSLAQHLFYNTNMWKISIKFLQNV